MRSSRVTFVTVGAAAINVLPHADNRVGILFTGSNGGRITLSHDPNVVIDNGLTIVQQSGPLELLIEKLGSAVCQAWYAISAGAGNVLGVIEVMEG
jgi:hypothetical protein